jgi:hypothetical protein
MKPRVTIIALVASSLVAWCLLVLLAAAAVAGGIVSFELRIISDDTGHSTISGWLEVRDPKGIEPLHQSCVGMPRRLAWTAPRSDGRRAGIERGGLAAEADLGVAVGCVDADMTKPAADHVDLRTGLSKCTAAVWRKTCGVTRRPFAPGVASKREAWRLTTL